MNGRVRHLVAALSAVLVLAAGAALAVYLANPLGTASGDIGARLWGRATLAVPSAAMEPTLPAGYELVVDTSAFSKRPPRRDELLVYASEAGPRIGRVIAGPGETVALRLGDVFADGELIRAPAGVKVATGSGPGRDFDEIRVPAGHVFVLADNRDEGGDSRQHGPVPARHWIGRVMAVRR